MEKHPTPGSSLVMVNMEVNPRKIAQSVDRKWHYLIFQKRFHLETSVDCRDSTFFPPALALVFRASNFLFKRVPSGHRIYRLNLKQQSRLGYSVNSNYEYLLVSACVALCGCPGPGTPGILQNQKLQHVRR
ncbi:hypothetical protein RRG08_032848 [Elysia crispata]|uniref:Uncharacterized protein n=1 Tax=Elysia crispata TaxID=231223 RepID=A0AAE1DXJ2_9GAST|nr:hypothetical protein RRG08_032848 [Elysia crispata]